MSTHQSNGNGNGHHEEGGKETAARLLDALRERGLLQDAEGAESVARDVFGGGAPSPEPSVETAGFKPADIIKNAKVVLEKRYLMRDKNGELAEDPQGMFRRVADALAAPDRNYGAGDAQVKETSDAFYQMMSSLEFLPNSPTLMNAGTGAGTLSACFVLPLSDSMEGIMKAAHDAAMVQKFGGGTGFSLSKIRPKGWPIKTTHGRACGPIAVLKHLSSVSTLVTQGGKRDGANMAVMDVHHPDILEFIDCKRVEGEIHNFNISVGASDEFMQAVRDGTDYPLRFWEDASDHNSPLVEVGRLDAREVFTKIVDGAWRNGEPGMIWMDEVNRNSPVLHIGKITATNPCGEQPLLPNESCNLGSIDVSKFVVDPPHSGEAAGPSGAAFDWDRLRHAVHTSVHLLDNVIDANKFAIPEIEEMAYRTRKIGLGVMGFADMLAQLGIPYDTEEGVDTGRRLMRFIQEESDRASERLAEERGPFPAFKGSRYEQEGRKAIRNACRLTVAPTGTISMIAGCSSGIEPVFSLAFRKHNILGGETLFYVDKNFDRIARARGFYSDELLKHLADGGSLQDREDVPEDVKRLFHVASDITPEYHVRMQAAFQESVDAAISKTINFPNEATVGDVETTYQLAWELDCKGITVYRAGSREMEVLTSGHESKAEDKKAESGDQGELEAASQALAQEERQREKQTVAAYEQGAQYVTPRERPAELLGVTRRIRTGRGNIYVTINMSADGRPFEVFATHGKSGSNDAAMAEAVTRVISLALRSGVDPAEVIKQLRGITDVPAWDGGVLVRSVPDAIALVLDEMVQNPPISSAHAVSDEEDSGQLSFFSRPAPEDIGLPTAYGASEGAQRSSAAVAAATGELCPDCQSALAHEEGCVKCYACGFSRC